MRWLMMLVAIVLGAGITWLLIVRRVTREVGQSSAAVDESAAGQQPMHQSVPQRPAVEWPGVVGRAADEAAGFGGAATHESSSRMGWDRTSQDEDALFVDDLHARDREVTDVLPIAGATPNGDLAGVTAPRAEAGPEPTPVDGGPTAEAPDPEIGATEPREQAGPQP